jgi:hypothetical protein
MNIFRTERSNEYLEYSRKYENVMAKRMKVMSDKSSMIYFFNNFLVYIKFKIQRKHRKILLDLFHIL